MKLYFMPILLCSMLIISCQKDKDLISKDTIQNTMNTNSNARTTTGAVAKLDPPTVIEGRYSFRDFEHLTSLYLYLDQMYTDDDQRFNDFVSKNEKITSVHTLLHTDVFSDPKERYQPFLTDPIMMALVNEHFEYQIGEYLVTYMNNDKLLLSDATDKRVQHLIRAMEKGIELDIESIPEGALWVDDTDQNAFKKLCTCSLNIVKINCSQIKVYGNCKNLWGASGKGTVNVNINNIFPPINETHTVSGNYDFIYTMPTPDPYILVSVSTDPKCPTGHTQYEDYVYNDTNSCDPRDSNTGWLWSEDNVNQGLSHRTAAYKNCWSTYEEAQAYSKHKYNGVWYDSPSDLEVTIDASRKWEWDCTDAGFESETKTGHKKSIRARVNTGFQRSFSHCDGDVQGTFKKTLNWNGMTWDINGFGDVDFECCD